MGQQGNIEIAQPRPLVDQSPLITLGNSSGQRGGRGRKRIASKFKTMIVSSTPLYNKNCKMKANVICEKDPDREPKRERNSI